MRVVLDTNVWIAALVFRKGVCAVLLQKLEQEGTELFVSPFILEELDRTLEKKFAWDTAKRRAALAYVEETTITIVPVKIPDIISDSADNHILACAAEARAKLLVTGDALLLRCNRWHDIIILSPRELTDTLNT